MDNLGGEQVAFELAENILAGRTQDEAQSIYASLDVVEGEAPVVTVSVFQLEQLQVHVQWHGDEHKNNKEVHTLIEQAQKELFMFILF